MPAPDLAESDLTRAPLPSGSGRDPALDGLRGVAVLLVYLFHYGGGLRSTHLAVRAFGYLTQAGWVGVELFFALSGFLITGLLWDNLGRPHALPNFFARRALRILPLYYGALAAAAVAACFQGIPLTQLRPFLVYAGFLQNLPPLVPVALRYPPPLPLHHLWSLAVEEQFYLLWPFLLLLARTRKRALHLCLGTFGLSCIFRAIVFAPRPLPDASPALWSPFLLTHAGGLALGGALALANLPAQRERIRRSATTVFFLAFATILAIGLSSHSFLLSRWGSFAFLLPAVEVAAVSLLALAQQPGPLRQALSRRPLQWLGRISYGFYLLHILLEPVFDAVGRWAVHADTGSAYQLVRLVVALPLTAAAAWLSYTWIERPILRLKRFFPRHS